NRRSSRGWRRSSRDRHYSNRGTRKRYSNHGSFHSNPSSSCSNRSNHGSLNSRSTRSSHSQSNRSSRSSLNGSRGSPDNRGLNNLPERLLLSIGRPRELQCTYPNYLRKFRDPKETPSCNAFGKLFRIS